jgi:hypothetical protein
MTANLTTSREYSRSLFGCQWVHETTWGRTGKTALNDKLQPTARRRFFRSAQVDFSLKRRHPLIDLLPGKSVFVRWLTMLLLVFGVGHTGLAIQIIRVSSTNILADFSLTPPLACNYASYLITNNDGVIRSNLWVTIGSFTGSVVSLGGGESGKYNVGNLPVNGAKAVFFYLMATNTTTSNQTHTITVYQGYPGVGTALTNSNFSLTVGDMKSTSQNKLSGAAYLPAQPVLGAVVSVTYDGYTGPLKTGDPMFFTPATYTNWNASAFQVVATSIIVTNNGTTYLFTNQLFFGQPGGQRSVSYHCEYWFRVVATTTTNTPMSPDGCFATGNNATMEHSQLGSGVVLPSINSPTNLALLTKTANVTQLYTNETVTYTLTFTNLSTNDIFFDRIVDLIPTNYTFVSSSASFGGSAIVNPIVNGRTNTWSDGYTVPAGTNRSLVFQAFANTSGYTTNTAAGYALDSLIDSTLVTTDSIPASCAVRVLLAPTAVNDSTNTLEDVQLTVAAPGVLTNDVEPNGFPISVIGYTQPAHGSVTVNANGSYTYLASTNYNGSDSFTYTLTNGNGRASTATNNLTITAVNDPPGFTKGTNQTVLEDAGAQTVANWATGISAGPADEAGQVVTFHVSNDNNSLFAVQPAISSSGTLTYTPAANVNGSATVTVYLQDDGGTANGGKDTSATNTFTITVTAVNDAPSFTKGSDPTVLEDAGSQTVANWATGISAGPANESSQVGTFHLSNDNNSLFSVQPAISSGGTLTFTPAANANGSATVTVYLQDDGGTANGGKDTSATNTFTITVTAVNDAPSFTQGADPAVLEDAGAQTVVNWATSISPGPSDESGQAATFHLSNDNNSLFSVQPSISSGGTLTYTPAANANGSATVTVYLQDDGGTANGGKDTSTTNTFIITVTAVNDAPSFTKGSNHTVLEDSGDQSVTNWATNISPGPANESGQALVFHVSNDNNGLFLIQPEISSDGTLTFTPAANVNGSAAITVYLQDNGGIANGGSDTSATNTFTITVTAVNDPPTLNDITNVTILENAGLQIMNLEGITVGPTNESGQTLTITATSSNPSLIPDPTVNYTNSDTAGTLTFTPITNATGTATITVIVQDNGGTANGGADSVTNTFTVAVGVVNRAPTLNSISNLTTNEDSGLQTVNLSGITPGPTNENWQTLTITATSSDPSLVPDPTVNYQNPDSTGTLTFAPVANANGTVTITVVVQDDGGTANGGVDSVTNTFTVTINAVNDPPGFTKGSDQTVLEDSGAQTVPNWATGIGAGPADESGQAVAFLVSNNNSNLFLVQPALSSGGTLTYTLAPNANGSATVTVYAQDNGGTANGGADTSAAQTFSINVTAVNDPPTLNAISNLTTNEDAGLLTVDLSGISAGPTNESAQALTITATSSNPALIPDPTVNYTSPDGTGTLTLEPVANASGTVTITVVVQDNGGTADGGVNAVTNTFAVTLNAVNDPPTLNAISNLTTNENAGLQTVDLGGITVGPTNEAGQTLTITATSSNPSLIPDPTVNYLSPDATGTLTFTPVAHANGMATITVVVHDNGGTANGGMDSVTNTFTVTINAVNDPPSFTKGSDQNVLEDAGAQTVANWATDISAGPTNESSQIVTFLVSNNNSNLFLAQPAISTNGTLTFTLATNANGSATVTVSAQDNGGTDNGGNDTSTPQTFMVNVAAANDPPGFIKGSDQTILEDAEAQTVASWATDISAGPADESGQVVTFHVSNDNNSLFSVQPAVSSAGTLTFTPAADANGSATVTVYLRDDGGTANGGKDTSTTNTFTITVTAVNDPPTLAAISDLTITEAAGLQTINLNGITVGPTNETGQSLVVIATSSDPSVIPDPKVIYSSPDATGSLTFTSVSDALGTVTVTVVVQDNGGTAHSGIDSVTNTFAVTVLPMTNIWSPGGTFPVNVSDANGPAGTGYTQTNYIGYLDVQATSTNPFTIQLGSLNSGAPGLAANFDNNTGYTWTIATTTRGVLEFNPAKFIVDTSAFTNDLAGGTFSVTTNGNAVVLVFQPNHPPVANPLYLSRAWGTIMRIPIAFVLTNSTTDPDGDPTVLSGLGVSTNGTPIRTNSLFILFAPTNNISECFSYVIRDVRSYRPGDTVRTATGWITVTVTNAISSVVSVNSSGGAVTLNFAGVPGYAYDVERSTNLTSWTVILTTNAPVRGLWIYTDAHPPQPEAFYRLRQH